MGNSVMVNFTPFQMILALAFQMWMIIFPIILIRKMNYLIGIIQNQGYPNPNEAQQSEP